MSAILLADARRLPRSPEAATVRARWDAAARDGDSGRGLCPAIIPRVEAVSTTAAGRGRRLLRVGVDIGGTFTDVVAFAADGRVLTGKVASSPDDYARAIVEGFRQVLGEGGLDAGAVHEVIHGTTVASNAILEGRGARTGLVTTRGFRDVLEIRRLRMPRLYAVGPQGGTRLDRAAGRVAVASSGDRRPAQGPPAARRRTVRPVALRLGAVVAAGCVAARVDVSPRAPARLGRHEALAHGAAPWPWATRRHFRRPRPTLQ
jgi:hypothetical protein